MEFITVLAFSFGSTPVTSQPSILQAAKKSPVPAPISKIFFSSELNELMKAYDEKNESWIVSTIMELLDNGNYKIPSTDIILYDSFDTSKNIALNIVSRAIDLAGGYTVMSLTLRFLCSRFRMYHD